MNSSSAGTREDSSTRIWLFVLPWDPRRPGGVDQVVLNLFRQVTTGGKFAPKLLIASWEHKVPAESVEDSRPTVRLRLRPPISDDANALALFRWLWCLPGELLRLHRYLRQQRVAVVNAHFPGLSALQFVLVKRLLQRELCVLLSFHGLDIASASKTRGLRRWLWQRLLWSADGVAGNSEELTQRVRVFAPTTGTKATAIHNGIDIDAFLAERDPTDVLDARLEGRPFILCVAAFEPKKGLDVLLRAFSIVKREANSELRLALVGTDHDLRRELEALAAKQGLSSDVVFFQDVPHSKLHALYGAASVFCLPSREEPFGLVLLEAGAFALPVVASRVGGIPEIISHGQTGRLVTPDDAEALARELMDLLEHPGERKRMGEALKRRVEENFTWRKAYLRYIELSGMRR
jgi:glycosyltransferase involved in cell wall biosynthesis